VRVNSSLLKSPFCALSRRTPDAEYPLRVGFKFESRWLGRLVAALSLVAWALGAAGVSRAAGGPFDVSRLEIVYGISHPDLPPIDELLQLEVSLGAQDGVLVPVATHGAAPLTISFARLPDRTRFSGAALVAAMERIIGEFGRRGFQVVYVHPDPQQINLADATDLRSAGDRSLRLMVWVGQVAQVRTVAKGERFSPDVSINHPAHAWIRRASPVRPADGDSAGGLFRRDLVDQYISALSTHPTRRVEASIAGAGEPGRIVLDYLVNEVRPWQVFAQVSNTGSETTGVWRTRLGFQHTQLTNRDDILNVDVVSSGRLKTRAGLGSYSRPLLTPDLLRLRVFGSRGDFKTDEIGFRDARYTGDSWQVGTELNLRLLAVRAVALSAQAGAMYNHYRVGNTLADLLGTGGRSDFLIPFVGARASRTRDLTTVSVSGRLEHSIDGVPNTSATSGIGQLGRSEVVGSWTVMKVGLTGSTYVLADRWGAPGAGSALPQRNLAHELTANLRGQYVIGGDRLVPQEQELLGGAYSVRGYPDSVLAADNSAVATLEYSFHPGRSPSWRWFAPAGLVFRGFADYGHRWINRASGLRASPALAERNLAMGSVGAGTEFRLGKWIRLRGDAGYVLREIGDATITLAEKGDVRVHILGSVLW
jgi:hypothetical protein